MNSVIRDLINEKVRSLTLKELIRFSKKEGISLTVKDARRILSIIDTNNFDISNQTKVKNIRKQLQQEFPNHYKRALVLLKPYEHYLE